MQVPFQSMLYGSLDLTPAPLPIFLFFFLSFPFPSLTFFLKRKTILGFQISLMKILTAYITSLNGMIEDFEETIELSASTEKSRV